MTPWEIAVDTGATFTDCLARHPVGAFTRVKLLSSGYLRARIVGRSGTRAVEISEDWNTPRDFLIGFQTSAGAKAIARNPETLPPVTRRTVTAGTVLTRISHTAFPERSARA